MRIKKLLSVVTLTLALILGTSVMAFAAPNDDVITALKNANVPESYIIQAENYLKNNTLTAAQASAVEAQITKAADIMKASGTKDASKLSQANQDAILQAAKDAGSAIGLTMTITKKSDGKVYITAKDAAGKVVANFTSNDVKQTGVNNSIIYAGIFLVAAAVFSTVFIKKKVIA